MKLLITTQAVDTNDPILGFFHGWLLEFAKHFERVEVICLREGVHKLPANVHVHSLGKETTENRFLYIWRFYKHFWNIYMNNHVDFVFFHMGAIYNILATPFFLLRKIQNTKFIWWKTHGILNTTGKIATLFVDEIVTAGSNSFNMSSHKVRVVGHAIDTEHFIFKERQIPETVRMMVVGRVTPIKKIEVAIDSVAHYKQAVERTVLLDIYGPVTDVNYKSVLDTQIVEKQLSKDVTFCGAVNPQNMPALYDAHDILLHPAYEAGFDKAVLEAMASGVCPITSISSFKDILGPYGLFISPRDVQGYAHTVRYLSEMPTKDLSSLHKSLRALVVESHSLATLSKRIFSIV